MSTRIALWARIALWGGYSLAAFAFVALLWQSAHAVQTWQHFQVEAAREQGHLDERARGLQQIAAARKELLDHPDNFLRFSNVEWEDRGVVNSYRELTALTITNASTFKLRIGDAAISWVDEKGGVAGATIFRAAGDLASGATVRYSKADETLESPTIAGALAPGKVSVTTVEIVDPPASVAQAPHVPAYPGGGP